MSTSPIVYKPNVDLTASERESLEAFLGRFDALKRMIWEPSAEVLGMSASSDQVKRFLLIDGLQTWLENDLDGLHRELSKIPNFPAVWPDRGVDADDIKTTFDSISNFEPLPPFPQDQLPVVARALRAQAIKLLQAADDIEASFAEASA